MHGVTVDRKADSNSAVEIAVRLFDSWNGRNLDAFIGMLSEDVVWYDPGMVQPPARGRVAVREFAESILEAFPDFRYEFDGPICSTPDGTRCAIVWRITATHLHPMRPLGYAATGRTASFHGVDVLDVHEGKVVRILTAFDPLCAAEQLLGMKLRPIPGTWQGRLAAFVQGLLARVARARRN